MLNGALHLSARKTFRLFAVALAIGHSVTGLSQARSDLGLPVASRLPPCPLDQTKHWNNCFGTYYRSSGDAYTGEWQVDKMNGPGMLVRRNGDRYIGDFLAGEFSGLGVEYSSTGQVKRAGVWSRGTLIESRSLDKALFPFSLSGSLREHQVQQTGANDELRRALTALQAAEIENAELRRRIEKLQKEKTQGIDIVRVCLSRGLKPGTKQFSECVSNAR